MGVPSTRTWESYHTLLRESDSLYPSSSQLSGVPQLRVELLRPSPSVLESWLAWPCSGNLRAEAHECNGHITSRRQHVTALLPTLQLIYSLCPLFYDVPESQGWELTLMSLSLRVWKFTLMSYLQMDAHKSLAFNSSTDCICINWFPFLKDVPLIKIESKSIQIDINI